MNNADNALENIKIERIPHDSKNNYNQDVVKKRQEWLSEKTSKQYKNVFTYTEVAEECRGNIENFIGFGRVPIGLVGPLLVNGDYAKGVFYVPFATTEGALVETYQRGAIAITKAGGVNAFIEKDANHLDPIFILKNAQEARNLVCWLQYNFALLKKEAESTTGFGKLISIKPYQIGRRVIADFVFFTNDAMGANMINIATEKVCRFIEKQVKVEKFLLRSNFSSEKKSSAANLLRGYGKSLVVEAVIPTKIISRFLFTTSAEIAKSWLSWSLSSFANGMLGMNAHFANGVAAMYIACGQDVAHVSNASVGILNFEIVNDDDLYVSLKLPNIICGTIGGGTALGTQRECLEILDCYGEGKAKKFAEIVAATLLAGELGICAGITTEQFLDPHKRARSYTREKAFVDGNER